MGEREQLHAEAQTIGDRYEVGFKTEIDRIFDAANVRLDTLAGKPINLFKRIKAERSLPPSNGIEIKYGAWTGRYSIPKERLGGPSTLFYTRREESNKVAQERAQQVEGTFFELRMPPWEFNREGKDLIYVSRIENAEMPNPTVHFISIDPDSQVYGRPFHMTAGDVGFLPCCYGNHSYAYPRTQLGRIHVEQLPSDLADFATTATIVEEGPGVELLAKAIDFGNSLPQAEPLEDIARFYDATVIVSPARV